MRGLVLVLALLAAGLGSAEAGLGSMLGAGVSLSEPFYVWRLNIEFDWQLCQQQLLPVTYLYDQTRAWWQN